MKTPLLVKTPLLALVSVVAISIASLAAATLLEDPTPNDIQVKSNVFTLVTTPTNVTALDIAAGCFPVQVSDTGVVLLVVDGAHQVWVKGKVVGTVTKTGWIAAP